MPRVISWIVMPVAVVILAGWAWAQEPSPAVNGPGSSISSPAGGPAKPSQKTLPKDIDPGSRARLPFVKREDLDADGKKTYDSMVNENTPYSHGFPAPIGMWMHSPKMAQHILPTYMYLRFGNSFGTRLTELTILVASREINAQFEWTTHEPWALKAGVEQQIIDVVKYRKSVTGLGEKEALIIVFGRELLGDRKVSSETFAHALKVFGEAGVTDLAGLMAFYQFLYTSSVVPFDIHLSEDSQPLLPVRP